MLDDDLRTQLADWVRPVIGRPAPDVEEVRRRARRHGLRRAALAAGATAVVIAVVAAVVLASPRGPGAGGRAHCGGARWLGGVVGGPGDLVSRGLASGRERFPPRTPTRTSCRTL